LNIDLRFGSAERLDAEDNSMDAVVGTLFYAQCHLPVVQKSYEFLNPVDAFVIEHVAAQKELCCDAYKVS